MNRLSATRNDERTILKRKIYAIRYMQMEGQANFVFVDERNSSERKKTKQERESHFINVEAIHLCQRLT